MSNLTKIAILLAATAMLAAMVLPAGAQLVPIQYSFPSIFQNKDVTAFSKDILAATDNENLAISFAPSIGGLVASFPSIVQTVDKSTYAEHTDFYQSHETSAFNSPYLGVGAEPYAGWY